MKEISLRDKIIKVFEYLKIGKDSNYLLLHEEGLSDIYFIIQDLIMELQIRSQVTLTELEFKHAIDKRNMEAVIKGGLRLEDEQILFEHMRDYQYWWHLKNDMFKTILKSIKPLIKKEGLFKPYNFESTLFFWHHSKAKNVKRPVFSPSKELVVSFLRSEKNKWETENLSDKGDLDKETIEIENLDSAMLEKMGHRIALLHELGIIDLIAKRIEEETKYSDPKCAQLIGEILGVQESKELKTIAGYVRGLRNTGDVKNNPLTETSRKKVIGVLSKINLETRSF